MPLNTRTAVLLIRPTVRATRWAPFLGAIVVGAMIVAVPTGVTDRIQSSTMATLLRTAAVCGALGAAFVLDDPAARTIETVPTRRSVQSAVRVVVVLPIIAASWLVVFAIVTAQPALAPTPRPPLAGLALEAAAMSATALALAAARLRRDPDAAGGPFAAAGLLLATGVAILAPGPVTLFPSPLDPHWGAIHRWWMAILVLAACGYLSASGEHRHRTRWRRDRVARHITRAGKAKTGTGRASRQKGGR